MAKFSRKVLNMIADMRGLPRDRSRSFIRETKDVSVVLNKCLDKYGLGKVRVEDEVMNNWREIIGDKYAHRVCPQKVRRDDYLVVTVPSAMVRSELEFGKRDIVRRLRSVVGCEHLRGVEFRIG